MKGIIEGRFKELLKDTKSFMEKQDFFRMKNVEITKKIKKKYDDNKDLKASEVKEELISLEKFFFFDNLLVQNTSKYTIQLSQLYQIIKLGKLEIDISEEDKSLLEDIVSSDFDLFKVEGSEVKTVSNEYTKSIIQGIESRKPTELEDHFNRMISDPGFQSIEA